jgi:hypothetical protein
MFELTPFTCPLHEIVIETEFIGLYQDSNDTPAARKKRNSTFAKFTVPLHGTSNICLSLRSNNRRVEKTGCGSNFWLLREHSIESYQVHLYSAEVLFSVNQN